MSVSEGETGFLLIVLFGQMLKWLLKRLPELHKPKLNDHFVPELPAAH